MTSCLLFLVSTCLICLTTSYTFTGYSISDLEYTAPSLFSEEVEKWTATGNLVTPFYTICSSVPLLGGFGALDGGGQFTRIYTDLPSHVFVVGTINIWMLDQRSGIGVVVKAGNIGYYRFINALANLVPTPSAWKSDLCGDPNLPDAGNIKFSIRFPHDEDSIQLWIYNQGSPSNSYFGIRDINLIFLRSPPSLSSSAYRCGNADPSELLSSYPCPCSLHHYSDGTNCQKCQNACGNCYGPSASECYDCDEGYIFQGSAGKCVPCHSSCKSCFGTASNQCKTCSEEAYMTSSQTCINKCESPMIYEAKNNADYCRGPCEDSTQFYYPQEKTCKSSCPKPYTAGQTMGYAVCSPESENTPADKVKEVTGQIANAGIILANTLSMGSSSGITLAVFAEILDYIKYMNILYSNDLELALLTWKSSFLFLKFAPDLPDSAKTKFDDNPPPQIFLKYGVDSSFLVNFFESLMSILIIAGTLAVLHLLEKSVKNKIKLHKYLQKARYLIQNFLLTMMYNAYGGVFFFAILQFKAIKFTSGLSVVSFITSVLCLGVGTFVLCWHLLLLLKQEDIRKNNPPEAWEKQFEKFGQENQGFLTLFGDFKNQKFNQQAFLLFFTLRQIFLSTIITTLYAHPMVESITFLTVSLTMVVYLIIYRPIQDPIDLVSQIYNEIIVVAVNISLVIMSVQDHFHQGSQDSRNRLSDMIIMLSLIFNSSITLFLGAKGLRWAYNYFKAKKNPLVSEEVKQILQKSTTIDDGTKKKLQLAAIRNNQISSEIEKNDQSSQNYIFRENSSFSLRNIDQSISPERFITLALPESLQTQEQGGYSERRMNEPPLKRPKIKKAIRPNKIYNQASRINFTNFSLNEKTGVIPENPEYTTKWNPTQNSNFRNLISQMTFQSNSQNNDFLHQDKSRIRNDNSRFYETNLQDPQQFIPK